MSMKQYMDLSNRLDAIERFMASLGERLTVAERMLDSSLEVDDQPIRRGPGRPRKDAA